MRDAKRWAETQKHGPCYKCGETRVQFLRTLSTILGVQFNVCSFCRVVMEEDTEAIIDDYETEKEWG